MAALAHPRRPPAAPPDLPAVAVLSPGILPSATLPRDPSAVQRPAELDPAALFRALGRLSQSEFGPLADKLLPHFQRQLRRIQERRGIR